MGFLLMHLITLLTLGFAVLSAMGTGDFEVKIEGRTTVTYAAGETTVEVKLFEDAGVNSGIILTHLNRKTGQCLLRHGFPVLFI